MRIGRVLREGGQHSDLRRLTAVSPARPRGERAGPIAQPRELRCLLRPAEPFSVVKGRALTTASSARQGVRSEERKLVESIALSIGQSPAPFATQRRETERVPLEAVVKSAASSGLRLSAAISAFTSSSPSDLRDLGIETRELVLSDPGLRFDDLRQRSRVCQQGRVTSASRLRFRACDLRVSARVGVAPPLERSRLGSRRQAERSRRASCRSERLMARCRRGTDSLAA